VPGDVGRILMSAMAFLYFAAPVKSMDCPASRRT